MIDKEAIDNLKNYIECLMEDYGYYKDIVEFRDSVEHLEKSLKTQQAEIEKKDNKLKDIKNHIKAELKMIDKLYNEAGWAGKEQYDGMKAAYKCVLNIYFENKVETENK